MTSQHGPATSGIPRQDSRSDPRLPGPAAPRRARISVVICASTYDRWDDTLAAVAAVQAQSLPAHEIIVVVDDNRELRLDLATALAGVTVLASAGLPGLAGGRSTGTAAATGDLVVFLDDDAAADPDWLRDLADRHPMTPGPTAPDTSRRD
jgi:GT2 family glycosyltransferase